MPERELRGIRGREIAMIFQEPMTALNPLYTVGDQIAEVLELQEGLTRARGAGTRADRAAGATPASPSRSGAPTPIRTSSRAASASAR